MTIQEQAKAKLVAHFEDNPADAVKILIELMQDMSDGEIFSIEESLEMKK